MGNDHLTEIHLIELWDFHFLDPKTNIEGWNFQNVDSMTQFNDFMFHDLKDSV